MNKLLRFIQDLWIKVQLEAPASVQWTVIPRLHEAKEIARLLIKPYMPIYQMQGQGQGGPLTVAYVGLQFTKPFLKNILFVGDAVEQQVGRIPFWRHNELAALSSSDIIIVEAAKHLIRKLSCPQAIVLPPYVHHVLGVQGDWRDMRSRFHKSVRKNELRLMRKYGYEYELSHDRQDFEEFYHQMYLPTMKDRHDELASPMSIGRAWQYFQHGWLFRIKRDGDWVAGVICYLLQDILVMVIAGVKNADPGLVHKGATVATYYAGIHWANQHGCQAVNFLGSDAHLEQGLFQHKRKWGAAISVPPNLHRQIWIKVQHLTPAVSEFLKENPFVVVDRDGKLHGLIVVDDPDGVPAEMRKEWEKRYATPGLSSLLVRAVGRFAGEPVNADDPDKARLQFRKLSI